MPIRNGAPVGAPTWIDLASSGLMNNDPQWDAPDGWTTYIHAADIKASLATAIEAGRRHSPALRAGGAPSVEPVEPMVVKDKGWMAMLSDPAGAFFGLWQPIGHSGFEVVNEAGAPVYHQLTTRDYGKALEFYRQVFGWQIETVSDTDEFRYSTALFDGDALLGVMDGTTGLPEGAPSNWYFFLGSDDVDKTVVLVTENGGTVVRDAEDTPYGRLAAVADPTGAGFNLSSL